MATTHILMQRMCKRAFIRDIIPMLCGIQVSSLRRSNGPPGKRQAPDACLNWSAWQVRCWTSSFLSLTAIAITFNCSRQVGTAILAMLSEDVLMSTLQSMSTSRGRETGGLKNGCQGQQHTVTPDPGSCDYHHAQASPLLALGSVQVQLLLNGFPSFYSGISQSEGLLMTLERQKGFSHHYVQ